MTPGAHGARLHANVSSRTSRPGSSSEIITGNRALRLDAVSSCRVHLASPENIHPLGIEVRDRTGSFPSDIATLLFSVVLFAFFAPPQSSQLLRVFAWPNPNDNVGSLVLGPAWLRRGRPRVEGRRFAILPAHRCQCWRNGRSMPVRGAKRMALDVKSGMVNLELKAPRQMKSCWRDDDPSWPRLPGRQGHLSGLDKVPRRQLCFRPSL
jgi:hypothetical protein